MEGYNVSTMLVIRLAPRLFARVFARVFALKVNQTTSVEKYLYPDFYSGPVVGLHEATTLPKMGGGPTEVLYINVTSLYVSQRVQIFSVTRRYISDVPY